MPPTPVIRAARPTDHGHIALVVDDWWGGRQMAGLLQPLFLEHFSGTSLMAEDASGGLSGFLLGFVSADHPTEAYVHFAGVAPRVRGSGLGRQLYDRFDEVVEARGVRVVRCVTSAVNTESVAFHEAIGFGVDGTKPDAAIDGGQYVLLSRRVRPPASPPRGQATWPPPPGTVLSGGFVEVRPTRPDDAEGLFAALDDPRVWTHLTVPRPQSPDDMGSLVEASMSTMHPWTVRLTRPVGGLAAGAVVGWSSYLEVAVPNAALEVGSTAYAPEVWATEVNPATKLLLLGYAFETLGFGRVQLKTDVRNTRSHDAIARLGATREGLLRRYQRRLDGSVRDTVVFSVTDDEWPAVRDRLRDRLSQ
ncbi:MAG: GNAT family N-acetyltransferase [Actinomycetes bacterium]